MIWADEKSVFVLQKKEKQKQEINKIIVQVDI